MRVSRVDMPSRAATKRAVKFEEKASSQTKLTQVTITNMISNSKPRTPAVTGKKESAKIIDKSRERSVKRLRKRDVEDIDF